MASSLSLSLPRPLRQFFGLFPLYTNPAITSFDQAHRVTSPTLWIHVPWSPDADVLSSDVECLKWQAYLALRGLSDISVRWDVSVDGALDARLPNLHVPLKTLSGASDEVKASDDGEGELLPAHLIPEWVDGQVSALEELEGYADEATRDESRAWVALLEGNVHAALVRSLDLPAPRVCRLIDFGLDPHPTPVDIVPQSAVALPEQAASVRGCPDTSPCPAVRHQLAPASLWGTCERRCHRAAVQGSYRVSFRTAGHRQMVPWLVVSPMLSPLGHGRSQLLCSSPTALDALVFAYLHCILHSKDHTLRFEVTRRVNLVAWERRVQTQVRSSFRTPSATQTS